MKNVAIITARGGSKRIPKKNIKDFCGKPIIAYSIEAALKSGVFSEVMVSTDSEEIKEVALKYGAKVPFLRSEATSNDFATTADVVTEVLCTYANMGESIKNACVIYPTAPFITPDILKEAMEKLEENDCDAVVPVVKFSFPPQRGFILSDGKVVPKYPECIRMRSQDLEPMFHDCGQFYCINVLSFNDQRKMFMDNTLPIIISEERVHDIDTPEDFKIAEMKYRMLYGE